MVGGRGPAAPHGGKSRRFGAFSVLPCRYSVCDKARRAARLNDVTKDSSEVSSKRPV